MQLAFQRGEQVLSVRHDPDGDYSLVASNQALYHRNGSHGWWRLGWEQVSRVRWDAPASQLLIFCVNGLASSPTVVSLSDPGPLLELAQERTTHTWLGRWHLRLAGNHSAVVELRRRPGTGEPVWAVISASDGLDSASADATADLARAVARLGDHLGVCDR